MSARRLAGHRHRAEAGHLRPARPAPRWPSAELRGSGSPSIGPRLASGYPPPTLHRTPKRAAPGYRRRSAGGAPQSVQPPDHLALIAGRYTRPVKEAAAAALLNSPAVPAASATDHSSMNRHQLLQEYSAARILARLPKPGRAAADGAGVSHTRRGRWCYRVRQQDFLARRDRCGRLPVHTSPIRPSMADSRALRRRTSAARSAACMSRSAAGASSNSEAVRPKASPTICA